MISFELERGEGLTCGAAKVGWTIKWLNLLDMGLDGFS